ncbi:putative reverse transcriptase domain-containing protein [Tanacetum coccineum]
MVSTMTTRNAGQRTAATRGVGTSEQDGREGWRSSRKWTMNNGRGGCSYKQFMAYNPKDYDGKGGQNMVQKPQLAWHRPGKTLDFDKQRSSVYNEMQKLENRVLRHAIVNQPHTGRKLSTQVMDDERRKGRETMATSPWKGILLKGEHEEDTGPNPEDFVVYYDASGLGLGCVLMQRGKVIAYVSRQLKVHKKNYTTHDLELGAVIFALKIWRHYLYGTKSVIYTNHKSLQHICNKKELNMCRRHWIELFSDYDCEIRYHPRKANVVANVLSRKDIFKPRRVRAMNMTIQSSIKDKILAAHNEASKAVNAPAEMLDVRILIMDEAHKSKYSVHPGADKMYYDMLTKTAYFLHIREDFKMDRLARLYLNEIVARHGVLILIISNRDSRFTSRFWQSMHEALGTRGSWDVHLPLVKFSYNNSYHSSVRCAPFEALYGRKCRSPIMWAEVREGHLIGPELVQENTEKIKQIKDRLKTERDCQKSYADRRGKPLEFSVGDYVLLKVSPWKGVVCFGKKGKLAPRFVGPFKILEKVGQVAYRLDLPEELNGSHDTFHVSNLKKCLADPTLKVPLDEIQVDAKFNFVEEPVEIEVSTFV